MLWREIAEFWKIGLAAISGIFLLFASGCSTDRQRMEILEIYCSLYEEPEQEHAEDSLKMVQDIVNRLGENGYAAVDSENQIDMTEAEQVMEFCRQVEAKEKAELTILVVSYSGGLTAYDLTAEEGQVTIGREYYAYQEGYLASKSSTQYQAYFWEYTEEGYLFFEEYHMPGYHGPSGHTALRVEPLDERCRELNRQYMIPVGYYANNLFLLDWDENDFGEVDFYDLFDILYSGVNNCRNPYFNEEHKWVNTIYQIPKEEFEKVIQSYFSIDSETLQSKTNYSREGETYAYRTRSLEDCEQPESPYPEVAGYVENDDGTITLTVHVVYPDANLSKVYAHEVVIRPLEDGRFQYVSNRIIPSEENHTVTWHVDRLTAE